MGFLPRDFEVPTSLETGAFRLRPITVHDVVKDYGAVVTNREHLFVGLLRRSVGLADGHTLEQNLSDLGWHQKEFQMRSSFDYAVTSPHEKRLLGCVYVDSPEKAGYDAEVHYWARRDGPEQGLEEELERPRGVGSPKRGLSKTSHTPAGYLLG